MNFDLNFQYLIQQGSLGLIRGVERLDHEQAATCANGWIRQPFTLVIADQ